MKQPADVASLDWFEFSIHRLALTASNHAGLLVSSRKESEEIDRLSPGLVGRWEHTPLLIAGLVAKAVHKTDTLEYASASQLMEKVACYYRELSGLFGAALPEVFPETVRSDLRGMAMGTWLQSEMLGLVNK
jgi:hypothetical protein